MSGTSADGLTVCAIVPNPFKIVCFKNYEYPFELQKRILQATNLSVAKLSQLHYELGHLYAQIVEQFLTDFNIKVSEIEVIGSHGQTVYHGPNDKFVNTLQIAEPSFMASKFHVPVVSDFRAKDIACGGTGAPLIPFFDKFIFGNSSPKILLNIGGISNFSVVGEDIETFGFDAGPGNTLIDLACQEFFNLPYDKNGEIAKTGNINKELVTSLLEQPFFNQKPPKSLDKNFFGSEYLHRHFVSLLNTPKDLISTLTYFTASAIAKQIELFVKKDFQKEIIVSGGGSFNSTLLHLLQDNLPTLKVTTSMDYGIDPQAKESAAFALFGWLALHHQINHCANATGAKESTILGKITL